jgi:hypothetical protein
MASSESVLHAQNDGETSHALKRGGRLSHILRARISHAIIPDMSLSLLAGTNYSSISNRNSAMPTPEDKSAITPEALKAPKVVTLVAVLGKRFRLM